ncbi:RNA methyltransferase [Fluviicola sp.]|uniref:RNA methyltransferase n=1 Tax=Fluviicola sp. TaxID=1917219 RepID=UPI002623C57E|nr:RNA methyltransferase [Fluviicola sp.]
MRTKNIHGYAAIGVFNAKTEHNIGTLWRSAYVLGASYIFTVGKRYKKQSSDVTRTWARIPYFHYDTLEDLCENIPYDCHLIAIELTDDAEFLHDFEHPKRAIYLLGSEDQGLPESVLAKCRKVIKLPGNSSLNVAVTGSIVLHDRAAKLNLELPPHHNE